MKSLTGTAPSLRQFEHIEEIYKYSGLPEDCPRRFDFAEVIRNHCVEESGMLVRVIDYPHWAMSLCGNCGLYVYEWIVQVEPLTDWLKWEALAPGGPYFFPINWLKRWKAEQVSHRAVEGA
jgi:hypothetical protein